MISPQAQKIAAQCRHYAMCKIDFLGTGICPPGREKHFVSYYPQGRMDIYHALARDMIPVTSGLVDIAHSCTLCGICDKQCHFYTGLRPMVVMRALKAWVDSHLQENRAIEKIADDPTLGRLKKIVGDEWATNDPATLIAYADDPFPLASLQMPRYVALPRTSGEIAQIVRLARKSGIPYVARGNGASVYGAVFTGGIVIDTNRMKGMEIDTENWSASVEAGVTAFELQTEVSRHGLRVNVAEPAATVCGNLVCSGIFSTWSNVYGTCADNLIDGEFIGPKGNLFRLRERASPNLYAFSKELPAPPGIMTKAVVPLHPTTEDEEGLLIPTATFEEALALARDLSRRRIGLAMGILGNHYLSFFMSPSLDLAQRLKQVLRENLGIQYALFVVADRYACDAIRSMTPVVLGENVIRSLMLGLPRFLDPNWLDLMAGLETNRFPYELLGRKELLPLLETVLRPSPETLASAVEEDLRDFYVQLYSRPEMTRLVWLNSFRILSCRMARHKHVLAFLVYLPLEPVHRIQEVMTQFEQVAAAQGLDHDFGFLTPLDLGKRGILEYDYYLDHTEESKKERARRAMAEIDPYLENMTRNVKGFMNFKYVFSQGCSRKENFLYL